MPEVTSDGHVIDVAEQAAADADLGAQTIAAASTDTSAALKTSTQTAIDAIIVDLNDLKAKLRASGVIGA